VIEGTTARQPIELNRKPLSLASMTSILQDRSLICLSCGSLTKRVWRCGNGLRVFSPYHDVGIGIGKDVAPKDIEALKRSRAVLAIIDGVDTGTIFEVGYARALRNLSLRLCSQHQKSL